MKRPLFDYFEPVKLELSEQEGGKVKVRGVFATAEKPTLNGRIYPIEVWEREIKKLRNLIQERKLFGELDHPEDGRTQLSRVSHLITDLRIEGNNIVGEAEVFDTDRGRNLKAIVKGGGRVGVSSRGTGSTVTAENGLEKVQDDFELISFDFVATPADENAYPQVFMEEVRRRYMLEINIEELKKTRPDIVDTLKKEAEGEIKARFKEDIAKIKAEVEENMKRTLEERFKKELIDGIEQARAEIERKVRDELQREGKIDEGILDNLRTKLVEYQNQFLTMGMQVYLQREYGTRSDFPKILEEIGDVGQYRTLDELKAKAKEIVERLGEDTGRVKIAEIRQRMEVIEKERDDLRNENIKLKEALEKALTLAKEVSAQLEEINKEKEELEEKRRKLREEVGEKKSVDSYLRRLEEASSEFTKIKQSLSRTSSAKAIVESVGNEGLGELSEMGLDVDRIVELATKRK